jgi:hypothetical protein
MQDGTAAQRLLVQGVLASTIRLVNLVQERREAGQVRQLMSERRRLLYEIESGLSDPAHRLCLDAMRAAIVESDRTMEALI